jgi:hypothetical protein
METSPRYCYHHHKDLKAHNTIATKYQIPLKIYWNRLPTHYKADRPHVGVRRTLQIDLASRNTIQNIEKGPQHKQATPFSITISSTRPFRSSRG